MRLDEAIQSLADQPALDAISDPVGELVDRALPAGSRARATLQGREFGHTLHPALVQLPIGFWTSAMVFDAIGIGSRSSRRSADLLVALGVASAAPAIAAGLADWTELDARDRRVAIVHGTANAVATVSYAVSLWQRVRGRRAAGVVSSLIGAAAASAGGYLGGHLVYADTHDDPAEAGDDRSEAGAIHSLSPSEALAAASSMRVRG